MITGAVEPFELGEQAREIMNARIRAEVQAAKLTLLDYLISVAQETSGAEVWRALFGAIRKSTDEGF